MGTGLQDLYWGIKLIFSLTWKSLKYNKYVVCALLHGLFCHSDILYQR